LLVLETKLTIKEAYSVRLGRGLLGKQKWCDSLKFAKFLKPPFQLTNGITILTILLCANIEKNTKGGGCLNLHPSYIIREIQTGGHRFST
jgi:hypothetical protein